MITPKLFIANKNYSSWSFRPWLAMKVTGIEFDEQLEPFDEANHNKHFLEFSPSKKVPTLHDGEVVVWESLAILEYLADRHPDKGFWPQNLAARAHARAISNEMHSGFQALRSECPMNMRRERSAIPVSDSVRADVQRIEAIWGECLDASGGPFLFGNFCNADAMYAPVVNRFAVYELSGSTATKTYTEAICGLPAWMEWETAGKAEPWIVEEDEA